MKAQVTCKICEQWFDYDDVHYIGNYDYEEINDCPVNLCHNCFDKIVSMKMKVKVKAKCR